MKKDRWRIVVTRLQGGNTKALLFRPGDPVRLAGWALPEDGAVRAAFVRLHEAAGIPQTARVPVVLEDDDWVCPVDVLEWIDPACLSPEQSERLGRHRAACLAKARREKVAKGVRP